MSNGNGQPQKVFIPYPPQEVFRYPKVQKEKSVIDQTRDEKQPQYKIVKFDYPLTGGQYVYHEGRPFPMKGHPYPPALIACEFPKRTLVGWLGFLADRDLALSYIGFAVLPRKFKVKIIERWIYWYLQVVNIHLEPHYLADRFYMDINRELRTFIVTFLSEYGLSRDISDQFALAFVTLIEYDTAYRYRIEDILTETTKEKLMANPVKEFQRLIEILAERDNRKHVVAKFRRFTWLFKYAFWFIKKPFLEALQVINFSRLQYDDIDRFQVRHWSGYNFFGETIEERLVKYPVEDPNKVPKRYLQ